MKKRALIFVLTGFMTMAFMTACGNNKHIINEEMNRGEDDSIQSDVEEIELFESEDDLHEEVNNENETAEDVYVPQYMYAINTMDVYPTDIDGTSRWVEYIYIKNENYSGKWDESEYNHLTAEYGKKYWVYNINDKYAYIKNDGVEEIYVWNHDHDSSDPNSPYYVSYEGDYYADVNQFVTEEEYQTVLDYINIIQMNSNLKVGDMPKSCAYADLNHDGSKELFLVAFEYFEEYSMVTDGMAGYYNGYICYTDGEYVSVKQEILSIDVGADIDLYHLNSIEMVSVSGFTDDYVEHFPVKAKYYYLDSNELISYDEADVFDITEFCNNAVAFQETIYYTENVKMITVDGQTVYGMGGERIYYPINYIKNEICEKASVVIDESDFMAISGAKEAIEAGMTAVLDIKGIRLGFDSFRSLTVDSAEVESILYNDCGFFAINYVLSFSDDVYDFYGNKISKVSAHVYVKYNNGDFEILASGIGEHRECSGWISNTIDSDINSFKG